MVFFIHFIFSLHFKKNQSKQVICVFSYILISIRLIIFHRTESKFLNYMYILTYIMTVQYTLNTNQSINQSIYSINQSEINGMNCQRILSLILLIYYLFQLL